MRQGLDIADVEAQTKIRAKYLRALENEEWGLLPGPTFVRTFLRTYAEAVGLDPHVLVDAYRAAADDAVEPEPAAPAPPRSPRGSRSSSRPDRPRARPPGPPPPLVLIGGGVVVIVVFLVVLGLIGGDDSPKSDKASKTEPTSTTKPPRRAASPTPSGVTVRIAPSVPTYACVDSGDGTARIFEGTLSQPRTFRNAKELRLNLGKRSVKITANGKAVSVAQTAEPYGLQVTKGASREITNGPRPCA